VAGPCWIFTSFPKITPEKFQISTAELNGEIRMAAGAAGEWRGASAEKKLERAVILRDGRMQPDGSHEAVVKLKGSGFLSDRCT
jgi:hypothetical protein